VLATANDTLLSIERLADETRSWSRAAKARSIPSTRSSARALHRRGPDRDHQRVQAAPAPNCARNSRARRGGRGADRHASRKPAPPRPTALREARTDAEPRQHASGTLDTTAVAVEGPRRAVDTLIAEEGAPLLAETRVMVADATRAIAHRYRGGGNRPSRDDRRYPQRRGRATDVIDTVGTDLTEASGSVADVVAEADDRSRR
jgi:hypothetical protein